jgi:hypothetical protein
MSATTVLVTLMTALVVHVENDDLSNSNTCNLGFRVCVRAHERVSVCALCVLHEDEYEVHGSNTWTKYRE